MQRQNGLSLVELMIGITLGLILLTGVMQVFLSSKNVFTSQQSLSRIQESGRMAIEFLSRDIRMAGFMGCASRTENIEITNTLKDAGTVPFNFKTGIQGYAQNEFPVAGSKITQTILPNTDVVVVRFAKSTGVYVTDNNDAAQLFVNNNNLLNTGKCKDDTDPISGLCKEDIVVVTDCEKAVVFQISGVSAGASGNVNVRHADAGLVPGNDITSWGGNSDKQKTFNSGANLMSVASTVYFIANGVSGRPSLWQSVNGISLELLEGIDDMHITYGVDTDVDQDYIPDEYELAIDVTDWSRVIAVRVEILVASIEDGVTPDHQVYTFPTDAVAPTKAADKRLRQIFTSTIALRNRIH